MLELIAKLRQETGRGKNDQVRKQGFIPAILYGHRVENLPLLVDQLAFERAYQEAGESTLIKLKIEGGEEKGKKERVVLIYEVANDPVSDKAIHVDFYQVKMDQAISVEVPLNFVGESDAIKSLGGVLVKNLQTIEIEALPEDLIHEIKVDISVLKSFEDGIRVKDLKLPDKVKATADPEESVALVLPPRTQEELTGLEETPVEKTEEVKVEERGKAAEEASNQETKEEREEKKE